MSAYTQSRFERREDDHYPTIDPRCLEALVESVTVPRLWFDPCVGKTGYSALIDQMPDRFVFGESGAQSIVTNPPYKRGLVDELVSGFVEKVETSPGIVFAACLLRTQWDHAKGRSSLFDRPSFAGLVRLRFRTWWSEDRGKTPTLVMMLACMLRGKP